MSQLCCLLQHGGGIGCGDVLELCRVVVNRQIPNRSPGLACNEHSCQTMQMAAAMGQSLGLIFSQKKEIISPFCLFFCVRHRMHTEAREGNRCMVMSVTGISPSR